jgi:glucose-6-phosphate 1-dehydrogenase
MATSCVTKRLVRS